MTPRASNFSRNTSFLLTLHSRTNVLRTIARTRKLFLPLTFCARGFRVALVRRSKVNRRVICYVIDVAIGLYAVVAFYYLVTFQLNQVCFEIGRKCLLLIWKLIRDLSNVRKKSLIFSRVHMYPIFLFQSQNCRQNTTNIIVLKEHSSALYMLKKMLFFL